jgi:hypothetical protein
MGKNALESLSVKIVERIENELREIELICADVFVKEKIHKILEYIDQETTDNKTVLEDLIKEKIKETKTSSPELNTNFYMLYRNFIDGRISVNEAQALYDMYVKELRAS